MGFLGFSHFHSCFYMLANMVFCHNIPTFYQVGLELGEKNTLEMGMVAKDYLQLISGLFVHGNNLKML